MKCKSTQNHCPQLYTFKDISLCLQIFDRVFSASKLFFNLCTLQNRTYKLPILPGSCCCCLKRRTVPKMAGKSLHTLCALIEQVKRLLTLHYYMLLLRSAAHASSSSSSTIPRNACPREEKLGTY